MDYGLDPFEKENVAHVLNNIYFTKYYFLQSNEHTLSFSEDCFQLKLSCKGFTELDERVSNAAACDILTLYSVDGVSRSQRHIRRWH